MKDKIALWGTDERDNDVLIALRLRVNDNCVDIWTFPKNKIDHHIAEAMVREWDKIDPDNLPQPHNHLIQDMGQPSLLPDHLRTADTDIISRTEKEWFVRVLSTKLKAKLIAEIEQLQAQTDALNDYDKDVWDLVQSYWTKVGLHFQSRDLNREDAGILRDRLNACFNKLKSLRKEDNSRHDQEAKANANALNAELAKLSAQIAQKNANIKNLFEQLKKLQERAIQVRLTKDQRNELRDQIDHAFEAIRNARKQSRHDYYQNRITGLKDVIAKMEKSIAYDEKELKFQQSRFHQMSGQLEIQLREAKMQLTQSQLAGKVEKLNEMRTTLNQVLAEVEREAKRDETAKAKEYKEAKRQKLKPEALPDKDIADLNEEVAQNNATETTAPDNNESHT